MYDDGIHVRDAMRCDVYFFFISCFVWPPNLPRLISCARMYVVYAHV